MVKEAEAHAEEDREARRGDRDPQPGRSSSSTRPRSSLADSGDKAPEAERKVVEEALADLRPPSPRTPRPASTNSKAKTAKLGEVSQVMGQATCRRGRRRRGRPGAEPQDHAAGADQGSDGTLSTPRSSTTRTRSDRPSRRGRLGGGAGAPPGADPGATRGHSGRHCGGHGATPGAPPEGSRSRTLPSRSSTARSGGLPRGVTRLSPTAWPPRATPPSSRLTRTATGHRPRRERLVDLQRLQAEYVNYKRRVDRDRELAVTRAPWRSSRGCCRSSTTSISHASTATSSTARSRPSPTSSSPPWAVSA